MIDGVEHLASVQPKGFRLGDRIILNSVIPMPKQPFRIALHVYDMFVGVGVCCVSVERRLGVTGFSFSITWRLIGGASA